LSGAELFYPEFILHRNKKGQKSGKIKTEITRKYIDKETIVGIKKEKIGDIEQFSGGGLFNMNKILNDQQIGFEHTGKTS